MSAQLTLLPTTAPRLRRQSLPLEAIDGFEDAAPSARLRELIRDLGLLQPIVVAPCGSGSYRVVEGRRRCKAIAQLAEAGEWPALACVDALVIDGNQSGRREVRGGLTLALHASRSPSPASELHAIETILRAGGSDSEAATVKEIAAQTGISVQTIRRRRACGMDETRNYAETTASSGSVAHHRRLRRLVTAQQEKGKCSINSIRGWWVYLARSRYVPGPLGTTAHATRTGLRTAPDLNRYTLRVTGLGRPGTLTTFARPNRPHVGRCSASAGPDSGGGPIPTRRIPTVETR